MFQKHEYVEDKKLNGNDSLILAFIISEIQHTRDMLLCPLQYSDIVTN